MGSPSLVVDKPTPAPAVAPRDFTGAPTALTFEDVSQVFSGNFILQRKYALGKMFRWGALKHAPLRKSEFYAVKNISFTVRKGEVVWIAGTSGSGKSTLAKLAYGLLVPDYGRVRTDGVVRMLGSRYRWNGFISLRNNLRVLGMLLGLPEEGILAYVDQVLDICELSKEADTLAGEFGKKGTGILTFTATLLAGADLYIIDGRSKKGRVEIQQKCDAWLNRRLQTSGALVFTDTPGYPLERPADRALILHKGEICWTGSPQDVRPTFDELSRQIAAEEAAAAEREDRVSPEDEDDEEDEEMLVRKGHV